MKRKRTPWPRWAKTARNLLLALLFGLMIWNYLERPLPYRWDIQRQARQWLMPRLEHHTDVSRGLWGDISVDWTDGAAIVSLPARDGLFYRAHSDPYRLTDGQELLRVIWSGANFDGVDIRSFAVYLVTQPPEGCETARLVLHTGIGSFEAEGRKQDGIFVFYVYPASNEDLTWLTSEEFSYELTFLDENGAVLAAEEQ